MTSDEEDREVLAFEDVAELMYSTEVTQQCYPPPPEVVGVQPPMVRKRGLWRWRNGWAEG